MIDALFLGTSTGLYCMTSCAPFTIPLICSGEERSLRDTGRTALLFMAGRLGGYIITGTILGAIGAYASGYLNPVHMAAFSRISYAAAGLLLLVNALFLKQDRKRNTQCAGKGVMLRFKANALLLGTATGFSLCPPFFAAASRVFGLNSSAGGAVYFGLFFIGSSIYFLPMFGLAAAGKHIPHMKTVARTAMIMIGAYFFLFLGVFNV